MVVHYFRRCVSLKRGFFFKKGCINIVFQASVINVLVNFFDNIETRDTYPLTCQDGPICLALFASSVFSLFREPFCSSWLPGLDVSL